MQVHVDPVLFLLQSRLGLLHVVVDRVFGQEGFGFGLVVGFGSGEERSLKGFAVDVEVLTVSVGFVNAEGDERIDDAFELAGVDGLAVPLLLDELEDGVGESW